MVQFIGSLAIFLIVRLKNTVITLKLTLKSALSKTLHEVKTMV